MNDREKLFLDWVAKGELSVDDEGRVWKHVYRNGHGGYPRLEHPVRGETSIPDSYLLVHHRNQTIAAHRLVYLVKCGDIPEGEEINHENGVKTDNRPSNLKPMTHTRNMEHALATGLSQNFGENQHSAKLTENDVRQIWHMHHIQGQPPKSIADRFPVDVSVVRKILAGKIWKHVTSQLQRN